VGLTNLKRTAARETGWRLDTEAADQLAAERKRLGIKLERIVDTSSISRKRVVDVLQGKSTTRRTLKAILNAHRTHMPAARDREQILGSRWIENAIIPPTPDDGADPIPLPTGAFIAWWPTDRLREFLFNENVRLISVEAGGGYGKTRLVREVAKEWEAAGKRVRYVTFDSDDREESKDAYAAFLHAISWAFRFGNASGLDEQISDFVRRRDCLLVLDNLDSVLNAQARTFLRDLAAKCPRLTVVVTTRFPFGPGARVIDLGKGLAEAEARKLFETRRQEHSISGGNMPELQAGELDRAVAFCHGIPLALELLAGVASRRESALTDLLDDLGDEVNLAKIRNPTPLEERHRSLWASVAWSYGHLAFWLPGTDGIAAQRAFRVCGLFQGPFSSDDFEAVAGHACRQMLDLLQVARLTEHEGSSNTWRLHPLIRDFAREEIQRDEEREALLHRFRCHFLNLLVSHGELGVAGQNDEPLRKTEPNWVAACRILLSKAKEGDQEAAEAFHRLRPALHGYSWHANWDGRALFREALTAFEGLEVWVSKGDCYRGIGLWEMRISDWYAAEQSFRAALGAYRNGNDAWGIGDSLRCLAELAGGRGEVTEAVELLLDSAATLGAVHPRDLAETLRALGRVVAAEWSSLSAEIRASAAAYARQIDGAESAPEQAFIRKARNLATSVNRPGIVADCDMLLGDLAGDTHERERFFRRALSGYRAANDDNGRGEAFHRIAWSLLQAAEAAYENDDEALGRNLALRSIRAIEAGREANLPVGSNRIDALLLCVEGRLRVLLGETSAARLAVGEALEFFRRSNMITDACWCLRFLAHLSNDEAERADFYEEALALEG